MQKFTKHRGRAVALYRANIDTDQIMPKQFLKRIERTGYGDFLFFDWRFHRDGAPNEEFVLNNPRYRAATVLLAGANFGCGSSREHAPWALQQYGFRAVLASSFADIFYNNSLKNGFLPIVLKETEIAELVQKSQQKENYELTIDLETCTVSDDFGFQTTFEIEEFRRRCLLEGLDDIALTLQNEAYISAYEKRVFQN